jgi:hypothetical protein
MLARDDKQLLPSRSDARGFALFARADFAQQAPGVDAEIVVVVPVEFDGVFADAFGG